MRTFLDTEGLRREMCRRGLSGAELAALAGLTGATVSHAITGRRVSHVTLRALARALTLCPVMAGADTLIPEKHENAVRVSSTPTAMEVERDSAQLPG